MKSLPKALFFGTVAAVLNSCCSYNVTVQTSPQKPVTGVVNVDLPNGKGFVTLSRFLNRTGQIEVSATVFSFAEVQRDAVNWTKKTYANCMAAADKHGENFRTAHEHCAASEDEDEDEDEVE